MERAASTSASQPREVFCPALGKEELQELGGQDKRKGTRILCRELWAGESGKGGKWRI